MVSLPLAGMLKVDDLQGPFQPKPYCDSVVFARGVGLDQCLPLKCFFGRQGNLDQVLDVAATLLDYGYYGYSLLWLEMCCSACFAWLFCRVCNQCILAVVAACVLKDFIAIIITISVPVA